jgi:RNA 3'-phosphate cyclase
MLEIDGAHGEGGGQLIRNAVALAAVTGTPIRVVNARASRDPPGLAAQHLAAVRAVATLCGARCEGLALHATSFAFAPRALRGGAFACDVGTAGSITLVLQALLPVMLAAPAPVRFTIAGGTDVRAAPPLDYLRRVLLAILHRCGARVECAVRRRGYYPRGGGEVEVAVAPGRLQPILLEAPGSVIRVGGLAHVAGLPAHVAERMRGAAGAALGRYHPRIDAAVLSPAEAEGTGGAVVVWARTENGVLGAGRVAERGVRAEALGAAAGGELAADLAAGAGVDVHAADQLVVYLALAGGGSLTTRWITRHTETAMWLAARLLPVGFDVTRSGSLARIAVAPAREPGSPQSEPAGRGILPDGPYPR